MNRIVYTGTDGNIYTINPDGTDSRRVTTSLRVGPQGGFLAQASQTLEFYTWPTWSRDGQKLAMSHVLLNESTAEVSLLWVSLATGQVTKVYENDPQASPIIAENVPHYMYWSPDSKRLAFIASAPDGLTLFVSASEEKGPPVTITNLGPIYFSWSQDSRSLLFHARDKLFLAESPFVGEPRSLGAMNPVYRAPALSADGAHMVHLAELPKSPALLLSSTQNRGDVLQLAEVGANAALVWSPAQDLVGVADHSDAAASFYNRLRVISVDGARDQTLVNENFLSFFWAPDGQKIAYVSVDLRQRTLAWKVVRVKDGETWKLAEFVPSAELMAMLTFYDQYAYSHSVWSPSGAHLVFTGNLSRQASHTNGSTQDQSKIYVLGTEKGSLPREIGNGRLAFWSWD